VEFDARGGSRGLRHFHAGGGHLLRHEGVHCRRLLVQLALPRLR
jgi:hypothetical protein